MSKKLATISRLSASLAVVVIAVAITVAHGGTLLALVYSTQVTDQPVPVDTTSAVSEQVSTHPYAYRGECYVEQEDGKWRQPAMSFQLGGGNWQDSEQTPAPCFNSLMSLNVSEDGTVAFDNKGDSDCFTNTTGVLWLKAEPRDENQWLITWGTTKVSATVEWLKVVSNGDIENPDPDAGGLIWHPKEMASGGNLMPHVVVFANNPQKPAGCRY